MTSYPKASFADAEDFAPGLLAIQENPPARLPRVVMYTVSLLFGILVLWATFGKLDIIASADGRLVPRSYLKVVQPADTGIVKEILVREGEVVDQGQVLLRMDPQENQADADTIKTELQIKSLQLRRIDAELSGSSLVKESSDPSDLYQQVAAQFRDRRQNYLDTLAQARDTLKKTERDYDSANEIFSKLSQTAPILKSQADAYSDLGRDGYAPQTLIGDKQRAYLENAQDLRAQAATVEGLTSAVEEASKRVSEVTSKYRSDLQNERIQAESEYRKYLQDKIKQDHKSALLELRAPVRSIVKDISTHTIGTVVTAGAVLLTLVPENEPMVAEVMVRNEDVGFVHENQDVKIKLVAYPFQKYGMIEGRIQRLWPDADESETSRSAKNNDVSGDKTSADATTSRYKALIALDSQKLGKGDHALHLVPGMQVIAEINQGKRTVLEYLLSPVQKTLAESGRER